MAKNKNRRVSFRIYDEVNLFYQKIDETLLTEPQSAIDDILNAPSWSTDMDTGLPEKNLPEGKMPGFQFNENETHNVNISASGMAFNCEDALKEGDYLAIRMLLGSSTSAILAYGKVVYCRNSNPSETQYPYFIGAHFIKMADEDRELLVKHVARKRSQQVWVRAFTLAAVMTVIVMPDVVFDLLSSLLHFLFVNILHFLHLAFEFTESSLDHLIEHFFHTDTHHTQIIVFYILVATAIGGLYWLWRAVPPIFQRCKESLFSYCSRKKASLLYYWEGQSLFNKIKLGVIGVAAITCYILFGM
ncbi:MAG: PilZ domain-containing protein [Methylobacter sp.]|nr:PilZ domain-containing protein [Methylobacter sp.]